MKLLLQEVQENDGSSYELYAELVACQNPAGFNQLIFSSITTNTNLSKEYQDKESLFLSSTAVQQLRDLLNEQN